MINSVPTRNDIEAAAGRIKQYVSPTPIWQTPEINKEVVDANIFFKMENLTRIGAFKIRGALNAVIMEQERNYSMLWEHGVVTHSSGNHGQALARTAQILGIPATIVMPKDAKDIKKRGVLEFGGRIVESEPEQEAREAKLAEVQAQTGAHLVHPYNDHRIIAGQATAAKEMFEKRSTKTPHLSPYAAIYAPVGGGGLLSGTALAGQYYSPETQIIGAEPEGADDAFRSMKSGKIERNERVDTIADGLLTNLGDKTFPIIRDYVDRIVLVSDDEIKDAMRIMWERLRVIVEPSGAVAFAALRKEKERYNSLDSVGVIVSGGNVDLDDIAFLRK